MFLGFGVILVVVATKDEVDARDFLCEFQIMGHSHVCQSYDVVTSIFFTKLLGHFS